MCAQRPGAHSPSMFSYFANTVGGNRAGPEHQCLSLACSATLGNHFTFSGPVSELTEAAVIMINDENSKSGCPLLGTYYEL